MNAASRAGAAATPARPCPTERAVEGTTEGGPSAVANGSSGSSIQRRLFLAFTGTMLVPALIAAAVGVGTIRARVLAQAQAQVAANLRAARAIYRHALERQQDALRIHASRRVVVQWLVQSARDGLEAEMASIRRSEGLDILELFDREGRRVFEGPAPPGAQPPPRPIVLDVLRRATPLAASGVIDQTYLRYVSDDLAERVRMEVRQTPRAGPVRERVVTSALALEAAAPAIGPDGRVVGVLYGATVLNRRNELVDRARQTVFSGETYAGRDVGTVTIFLGDVRVATNVRNPDGTRAIATRASAEVAAQVLDRGETWHDRAFVVTDWYLAAYEPIRDLAGRTIGMLYVGTLERPYTDMLWRSLYVFLGVTVLGLALVHFVAMHVAGRIAGPIGEVSAAARRVARGDYTVRVPVRSHDEVGQLAGSFNAMAAELERAHRSLRDWAATLERRVEERGAQLAKAQSQLVQAAKMAAIGKLAAGVAHEINNPLTGVLTNASLLLEDLAADDPRREDLATIVHETLRCRKIVKGLLDFARQTPPQKTPVDVNRVIEDTLALVRSRLRASRLEVRTALDPALPPVMADGDQIRQVVLNLVLNAVEAMPAGGELRVASVVEAAGRAIVLSVGDTGPGIPEAIRDRLFEPFFTTKKTGTGLGLAIVDGIVAQHRGTIRIDTVPGRGTTVHVRLPFDGGASDDEAERR